jgi:hypothetical protein
MILNVTQEHEHLFGNLNGRDHFGDLRVSRRIISVWILKK